MYDVVIIGAGVVGCAIARELARKDRRILVLEKASDVCEGTSKANSGIVHAGHDAKPGTLKARFNVQGNRMMPALAKELDIPFVQNGSLVLCLSEDGLGRLQKLYEQGKENGVEGLRMLDAGEVKELEPSVSGDVKAALYAPAGGIICPFLLTIALAENACTNGVEFRFHTEVKQIKKKQEGYGIAVIDHNGQSGYDKAGAEKEIEAKIVINAAGVYADVFHNMVSEKKIHITPRKGEYCLMDKRVGGYVKHTLFQLPTAYGKGVLVTPTVHGNLLIGPTAVDTDDPEEVSTTAEGIAAVLEKGAMSVEKLPGAREVITSFAGLRAHEDQGDFVIGEAADAPGFIDAAGIESPGLTCAPAIGVYVAGLVDKICPAKEKEIFTAGRQGIPCVAQADDAARRQLIEKNPLYANVICRCELVTEGEIVDAINRPLGATTLDGVKRRTRAGMGRCQAGFCSPKVLEILARELQVDMEQITKSGGESYVLIK